MNAFPSVTLRLASVATFACLLLAGCAATGPADDGFVNSQESVDIGRLFGDDAEGYTLWKSGAAEPGESDPAPPAGDDAATYAAYLEWRRARDDDSPEYRKFRLWQEFEAFERWRQRRHAD